MSSEDGKTTFSSDGRCRRMQDSRYTALALLVEERRCLRVCVRVCVCEHKFSGWHKYSLVPHVRITKLHANTMYFV